MGGMLPTTPFSQGYTMDREYTVFVIIQHSNIRSRKALKKARPTPGGFECAVDEETANNLFHHFAVNDLITWATPKVVEPIYHTSS